MARKKQTTSQFLANGNNLKYVSDYLSRAIREEKILSSSYLSSIHDEDWIKRTEGKKEFSELSLAANDNEKSILQCGRWVDKYLSENEWKRCKTAIRQKMLAKKRKYQYRSYRLPANICAKLNYFAKSKNMTRVKALECLIIAAYDNC